MFFLITIQNRFFANESILKLNKWISDIPENENYFSTYKIKQFKESETGVFTVFIKEDIKYKVSMLKRIAYQDFKKCFLAIENDIVVQEKLKYGEVNINELAISFGLTDSVMIIPDIAAIFLNLSDDLKLEISQKLLQEPVFRYYNQNNTFSYEIVFEKLHLNTGNDDSFQSWEILLKKIYNYLKSGMNKDDRDIRDFIIETKVLTKEELETVEFNKQKDPLKKLNKKYSRFFFGVTLDLTFPNFVAMRNTGLYIYPFSYHKWSSLAYLDIRDIGHKKWSYLPFRVTMYCGYFFELNYNYLATTDTDEFDGWLFYAGGISSGVNFSVIVPRIIDNEINNEIIGLGGEVIFNYNFNYYYPYNFGFDVFFVLQLFPENFIRPEILIGCNTDLHIGSSGSYIIASGLDFGLRIKVDLISF